MSERKKGKKREFDDIFDEMNKLMEKIMSGGVFEFPANKRIEGPFVWGKSVTIGPDGKPIIKEFGNTPYAQIDPFNTEPPIDDEKEPLIDILEGEKKIIVVTEVPGVNKEDIKVSSSEKELEIKAGEKYYKKIELPAEVIPNDSSASYKNGVLEIRFTRKKTKEELKKIDINVD